MSRKDLHKGTENLTTFLEGIEDYKPEDEVEESKDKEQDQELDEMSGASFDPKEVERVKKSDYFSKLLKTEAKDDEEEMDESSFTRKHYQAVADILKEYVSEGDVVVNIANDLADMFAADNPRFAMDRFMKAAGVQNESKDDEELEEEYNGWKNRESWNIALWINNDEGLYNMAKGFQNYEDFAADLAELGAEETPDGVSFADPKLDIPALDEVIAELSEE